ncbi:MAG TPA: hypothetical protein VF179_21060 [Thermoanaerobaculia bacterium]|nr:hypothetical protein [Thermoanaerobaculia bacterium]
MRRVPLLLLAFFALPAFAAGPDIGEQEQMARLVSPAAGDEFTAGSTVTIEWEELALPEHTVEWEAFLSVDGGRTWPLRVTPHLDISIRRFTFRVPDLPTREARIMLRFGDERREVGMEAPQRFSIVPAAFLSPRNRVRVLSRGERARAGDEGVVVWVRGSRSGGNLREVVALDPVAEMRGVRPAGLLVLPPGAPVSPREEIRRPSLSLEPAPRPLVRTPEKREPRPAAVPVRLLIRRFNE